jgi:hypothetical protein
MNKDKEMMQNKSEDVYLFYSKNQEFLNGSVKWTAQNMRELVELILSFLLFIFLLSFLAMYPLDFWIKLILILFLGGISVIFFVWGILNFRKERYLANKGEIISGYITSCILTNRGSDTDIFEVTYKFRHQTSSIYIHLAKKDVEKLVGKRMLVLYCDENNFMPL